MTGGKRETTITIITVVESIAVAVGSEFKVYLKELVPMILKSMIHDSKEKQVTGKVSWEYVCLYIRTWLSVCAFDFMYTNYIYI